MKIPSGTFMMGNTEGVSDDRGYFTKGPTKRYQGEGPPFRVTISNDFNMGKYEVTQAQWQAVMGYDWERFHGERDLPVQNVSWYECQRFISELNSYRKGKFRLPTEAEWEYACRAGTDTKFYWGDDEDVAVVGQYCWYVENSDENFHLVGQKLPNPWGLYDMVGNVREWCEDWYGTYPTVPVVDPKGPSGWLKKYKIIRGCSYYCPIHLCRSVARSGEKPESESSDIGFRIVGEAIYNPVVMSVSGTDCLNNQ